MLKNVPQWEARNGIKSEADVKSEADGKSEADVSPEAEFKSDIQMKSDIDSVPGFLNSCRFLNIQLVVN